MGDGVRTTLEVLGDAIDATRIHVDADELIAAHALLDRLTAKVQAADAAFDAAQLWDASGASSHTRWLVTECGMTDTAARRHTRTATRLAALPAVAAAAHAGLLSAGQVELIASWVRPRHLALFAEHEHALVPALTRLDVDATVTVLRDWTQKADAVLDGVEPPAPHRSSLRLHTVLDDHGHLDADLALDDLAVVSEALRLARRRDDEGEHRTRAERDADALVDLCRRALRDERTPRTTPGRQRPGVNVVIDTRGSAAPTDAAATTLTGHPLGAALTGALCCDATVRRVLTAGSEILDLGRTTPTLSRAIRDAVHLRDRHCRFRGCDRTIDWCEIHHLHHQRDGGPHAVRNCVLLCAHHHHVLHRDGWSARIEADGTLVATRPDGHTWATHPPGPRHHPPPPPTALGA